MLHVYARPNQFEKDLRKFKTSRVHSCHESWVVKNHTIRETILLQAKHTVIS